MHDLCVKCRRPRDNHESSEFFCPICLTESDPMSTKTLTTFITAAIVAHPDRAAGAQRIQRILQGDKLPSERGFTPDVWSMIFMDQEGIGCDDNHIRAWEWLAHQDSPWLMVLEDDALPVDSFNEQLAPALLSAPTSVVSLYLGRTRPGFYQEQIAHALTGCSHPGPDDQVDLSVPWVVSTRLLHCVGVVMRREVVQLMIEGGKLAEFVRYRHAIDQGITEFCRSYSLPIGYTVPSLVDHADCRSLARHSDDNPVGGPRVAWVAGEREDWSSQFKLM